MGNSSYSLLFNKFNMLDNIVKKFDYLFSSKYSSFINIKNREIFIPNDILKSYQIKLKNFFESKYSFPDYVTWFVKNKSIKDNAELHLWKKYIINIDIQNFFDFIDRKKLFFFVSKYSSNPNLILDYLIYKWKLPQGAPSSPILSNIVFNEIDKEIISWLKHFRIKFSYSRYVDDISIWFNSYDDRYKLYNLVKLIIEKHNFRINVKKTKLFQSNKKLFVTGMIINDSSVWIWYKKYKELRKKIYKYLKFWEGYFPYIKWYLVRIKGIDYYRFHQLKIYFFSKYNNNLSYQELFWINEKWYPKKTKYFDKNLKKEKFSVKEFYSKKDKYLFY